TGAVARRLRLEDRHVEARFRGLQVVGRRQPGIAAADHRHVGRDVSFNRRVSGARWTACRPVAAVCAGHWAAPRTRDWRSDCHNDPANMAALSNAVPAGTRLRPQLWNDVSIIQAMTLLMAASTRAAHALRSTPPIGRVRAFTSSSTLSVSP